MNRRAAPVLVLLAVCAHACGRSAPELTNPTALATQDVASATYAGASQYKTPTPPQRPTPTQDDQLPPIMDCVTFVEAHSDAEGSMLVGTFDGWQLLELRTQRITVLLREDQSTAYAENAPLTSPDWRYFAFQDDRRTASAGDGSRTLRVIDATGKDVVRTAWNPEWGTVSGWVNASTVAITLPWHPGPAMVARDVFAQTETEHALSYPDLNVIERIPWYREQPTASLDPSQTLAVYAAYPAAYALWDIPEQRTLWTLKTDLPREYPVWSPDGEQFAVVADSFDERSQLLVVSRDGVLRSAIDSEWNDPRRPYGFRSPRWDPTSTRIAFDVLFAGEDGLGHTSVAVLDTRTGEVTDYCVDVPTRFNAVWSPDGRYLAGNEGLVVDLVDGVAFRLGELSFPIAWLAPIQ